MLFPVPIGMPDDVRSFIRNKHGFHNRLSSLRTKNSTVLYKKLNYLTEAW
jgi:hypothetical protein